ALAIECRREFGNARAAERFANFGEGHELDGCAERIADRAAEQAAAKDAFVCGRWLAAKARRIVQMAAGVARVRAGSPSLPEQRASLHRAPSQPVRVAMSHLSCRGCQYRLRLRMPSHVCPHVRAGGQNLEPV